jgi:hypothetical protein
MGDLRRNPRLVYNGKINLTWSNEGGHPFARNGLCLDISTSGLKVQVDSAIPLRTVITVRAKELELHGSASVRSCVRTGAKYTIGLEFVGGMRWQLPASFATSAGL